MPKRKEVSSTSESDSSSQDRSPTPAGPGFSSSQTLVDPMRTLELKKGSQAIGPVIYWMSRDQRMNDNWALLYAAECAAKTGSPVAVCFNLVPSFLGAGARHFGFMLRGLKELAPKLEAAGIRFFLLMGEPSETIPELVSKIGAKLLVTDYSPLRLGRKWKEEVTAKLSIPFIEVDAHNVVPVWVTSDKREVGARTLRPRIHRQLPTFLKEFPDLPEMAVWGAELPKPDPVDWDTLIEDVTTRGAHVPEVTWCVAGGEAAEKVLADFLSPARLSAYGEGRNIPSERALSNLSPYFHYGQIAPQRVALEASKHTTKYKDSVERFLEEMVVRRELSDNFCHYTPNYDSLESAAGWAKESLRKHTSDKREYIYTRDDFETGKTHDELWNAAQLEMVHAGKMHGFMRMYWAKKILEWTNSPEEAIEFAIFLNDKYSLDGRDPSGYVGVMWSMCGIHDRAWTERPIFGKIRYMNYAGCKRKFSIPDYVSYVDHIVRETKLGKAPFHSLPPKLAVVRKSGTKGSGKSGDKKPSATTKAGAAKAGAEKSAEGGAKPKAGGAKPSASAAPGGGDGGAKAKAKGGSGSAPKVDLDEFDALFGADGGGEVEVKSTRVKRVKS